MNINNIKKTLLTNRYSKLIIIILLCLLLIYYFILFFSPGITYGGAFLKKETTSLERVYSGHFDYDNNFDGIEDEIMITVQGRENKDTSANVIFQYPDNYDYYTVEFQDAKHWDAGIIQIFDIDENIIFEGVYDKDERMLSVNGTVHQIVDVIYEADGRIRGELGYLIMALLLFIMTWIDYCFPLFFFRLNYSRAVYNPEPSESYEFWQRVRWKAAPILGIILMIMAL